MNLKTFRTIVTRLMTVLGGGVLALVFATGAIGVAQATVESVPNNSVNSAKIANNSVQSVDIKDGQVAAADLNPIVRPMWAKVGNGTGGASLIGGRGAVSAEFVPVEVGGGGPGVYRVTFSRPVTDCGWTATLNDNGANVVTDGRIGVELEGASAPGAVWVRTWDAMGNPAYPEDSDGFTVAIHC